MMAIIRTKDTQIFIGLSSIVVLVYVATLRISKLQKIDAFLRTFYCEHTSIISLNSKNVFRSTCRNMAIKVRCLSHDENSKHEHISLTIAAGPESRIDSRLRILRLSTRS